jgi:hypothetical protein
LREERLPERFRWSAPGFIDDRTESSSKGFQLPGITDIIDPDQMKEDEKMYLNRITAKKDSVAKETNFYFAYPNLYMVTDEESILLTHGHYLEAYWSAVSEWAVRISRNGLKIGRELDVGELVAINFPLCQLACSGIGQAGPLTKVVQKVQREVKDRKLKALPLYLENLDHEIDKSTPYEFFDPREWVIDLLSWYARRRILNKLKIYRHTRDSEEFIDSRERPSKEVLERFRNLYQVSLEEIRELNEKHALHIPKPQKVIFGHTHRPIMWDEKCPPRPTIASSPITLYNTGGWLWRETTGGDREFCGAVVFTYNSDDGFASHMIS